MRKWLVKVQAMSRARVAELRYFCLQYGEKRARGNRHDLADVAMIESAAAEACGGSPLLYDCLMDNVTKETAIHRLNVPMGARQFYAMRRRFFAILDEKQHA